MKIKALMVMLLATSFLTLASCGKKGVSSESLAPQSSTYSQREGNNKTKEIYDLYKASGGTLTYDEWLATIKGEKGDKGDKGEKGADGTSILTGNGSPSNDLGKQGDSYIDLSSWDYWIKESSTWVKMGNIKGPKGDSGDGSQSADNKGLAFYPTDDNSYYVAQGLSTMLSNVVIPAEYNGLPVVGILSNGFRDSAAKSISLPNSIRAIGPEAFFNCSSLESITIPNGVTSICDASFSGCNSLKSVTIPNSVKSIGSCAFSDCYSLESIAIPDSVVTIDRTAFSNCSEDLFTRVDRINPTYANCTYLKNGDNPYYALLSASFEYSYYSSTYSISISNGCRIIANNAELGSTGLTSISIPDSVKSIGDGAFSTYYRDYGIQSITIPDSVEYIGKGAFYSLGNLNTITLPFVGESVDKNQFIGHIFGDDSVNNPEILETENYRSGTTPWTTYSVVNTNIPNSLQTIVLSQKCTSLANRAFCGCGSITSMVIPNTVTKVGSDIFDKCLKLTTVNCEATSKPSGWANDWKGNSDATVNWGYSN